MASVVCVCAVLILVTICQARDIVKGLYCRDPDTGKLYELNATWPSQTFCGNYICKLRRRNDTETRHAPMRRINISKYKLSDGDDVNDMKISASDNFVAVTQKISNDKQPVINKSTVENKTKLIFENNDNNNGDRYLTESEIKTITEILHTIKKSDLEAIVDIYNLAQDIYKEIDNVNMKKLVKETIGTEESHLKNDKHSYWYDPLYYNGKHPDMSREGTNIVSTKRHPLSWKPTFFKGPLVDRDFGKLPYYYPISDFQRLSSYMHSKQNDLENAPTENLPCTKPVSYNYVTIPWYGQMARKTESQPMVQKSNLLPYPFSYIYHYNISGYPSGYYYNHPWAQADDARHPSYWQSFYGPYITHTPSYIYSKPDTSPEEKSLATKSSDSGLLDKLKKTSAEKVLPEWQTPPLSEKVLEEVRAHVADKSRPQKPILLKKPFKLERVGKVIKLDELTRKKREVINYVQAENIGGIESEAMNELEAYIDKIMCEEKTEPGYFSIGNMSHPFPGCCPKKINNPNFARKPLNVNN